MADTSGDVVCVGLIERGQAVDWSGAGPEPDHAEWIDETIFSDILSASAKARIPVLPKLDLYAQTRLGSSDCSHILVSWSELEAALRGTRAAPAAEALRRQMELCANGPANVELLIEGP